MRRVCLEGQPSCLHPLCPTVLGPAVQALYSPPRRCVDRVEHCIRASTHFLSALRSDKDDVASRLGDVIFYAAAIRDGLSISVMSSGSTSFAELRGRGNMCSAPAIRTCCLCGGKMSFPQES